jgi:hypothetical protein
VESHHGVDDHAIPDDRLAGRDVLLRNDLLPHRLQCGQLLVDPVQPLLQRRGHPAQLVVLLVGGDRAVGLPGLSDELPAAGLTAEIVRRDHPLLLELMGGIGDVTGEDRERSDQLGRQGPLSAVHQPDKRQTRDRHDRDHQNKAELGSDIGVA